MSETFDKMSHVFSQKDLADFKRIESEIERDQASFLRVADNLIEVRDRKLYGIMADTFEEYIRIRWGWTKQRAYQIIAAKRVVDSLPPKSQLVVDSETKARPLVNVPEQDRPRVIRQAVSEAPNGKPTARHIEEAAERVTSPPPQKPQSKEPPAKEILIDETGWPVPDNLEMLFDRIPEVREKMTHLSALRGMLRRVKDNRDVLWRSVNLDSAMMQVDQLFADIKEAIPYAVCPYCQGRAETLTHCANCKQRGVVSKFIWEHAIPEELKAVRQKSVKK